MEKKKSSETMEVTIPETGRMLTVPKGLSGSALARHVEGVLQAEKQAAIEAEQAAQAVLIQQEEDRFAVLERQLAEERASKEALHREIESLKKASPEAASMVTVLSQMTTQANEAFERNQRLLAAMNRFVDKKGGEIADVSSLLAQQNEVIDQERIEKRDAGRRVMDELRIQQGLAPIHPELLDKPTTEGDE